MTSLEEVEQIATRGSWVLPRTVNFPCVIPKLLTHLLERNFLFIPNQTSVTPLDRTRYYSFVFDLSRHTDT